VNLTHYLLVFCGAGLGGMLRHAVNSLALARGYTSFPVATLCVNVVGSLLMGLVVEYFALRGAQTSAYRLFLTTGVLGGFTTFSAFSLETGLLIEKGHTGEAAGYAVASVLLSLLALFCGLGAVRYFLKAG
jgi:fluoride exporter